MKYIQKVETSTEYSIYNLVEKLNTGNIRLLGKTNLNTLAIPAPESVKFMYQGNPISVTDSIIDTIDRKGHGWIEWDLYYYLQSLPAGNFNPYSHLIRRYNFDKESMTFLPISDPDFSEVTDNRVLNNNVEFSLRINSFKFDYNLGTSFFRINPGDYTTKFPDIRLNTYEFSYDTSYSGDCFFVEDWEKEKNTLGIETFNWTNEPDFVNPVFEVMSTRLVE